ncbi:MAG: carbohydrate ABC transporter permease [Mycobacteriales bacterium]
MTSAVSAVAPPRRRTGVGRSAVLGGGGGSRLFTTLCAVVLLIFAAIWAIPLLWALDTSFRPESEINTHPTSWWTSHPTLSAYHYIFANSDLATWYLNSFITATVTMILTVVVCSMAGFALSRTRMAGRRALMTLLVAGILIPGQVLILPSFQEFNAFSLLNTYWAIILPAIATPVAVLIFAAFFSGIPADLVDAARVDGASWLRIYTTVFIPLSRPAVSAVAIFTFVWTWNGFLWPLLVLTSTKLMTIPVGLASVQSAYGIIYGQVMASAVMGAAPLVVVFLFFQRRIVEGMSTTGIK